MQRAQFLSSAGLPLQHVMEELTGTLRDSGTVDPRRVAADIVAAVLDVPSSSPLTQPDSRLESQQVDAARRAALLLGRGAPFAYAVGSAPFRHLTLQVDERVLVARPETEMLVEEVLERMVATRGDGESWGTAVDIGTGSGAIALSLATEGRFERVIATDASSDALDVARLNHRRLGSSPGPLVEFRQGWLVAPVRGVKAAALVSNPPYVAFSEIEALPASVRNWEPPIALVSGHDGLSATGVIVREGAGVLASGGLLALEVDERRASLVIEMIMRQGRYTNVGVGLDLTGRERFVFASRI